MGDGADVQRAYARDGEYLFNDKYIAEKDGKTINSVKELKTDDIVNLILKDGVVKTRVEG